MQTEMTLPLTKDELACLESLIPYANEQEVRSIRRQLTGMTDRQLAEKSLHEFMIQAWGIVEPAVDYIDGKHIQGLALHLEAVTESVIRNLLVNIPPGHCKSLLLGVFWPAWVWTFRPSARFFFASYAQELSIRDSLKCRQLIDSNWYQSNWGDKFRIIGDQNQKIKYENSERGWRMATSVGGRGTGEHPDFIVVDDPHNAEQARSDAERQNAIEWWSGTMSLRGFVRGSNRVIIMQRLHEMDLSGYVLSKGGFEHICLPMEWEPGRMKTTSIGWNDWRTKPGELLWPEAVTRESLAEAKVSLTSMGVAGQFQQRPAPAEGGMFKRADFKKVGGKPEKITQAVRYWDKAGTEGDGDYSVGCLMAFTGEAGGRQFYVVDVKRGQWSSMKRNEVIRATAEDDRDAYGHKVTTWVEQEPGSGGKESAELTIRDLAGHYVKAERVTGDKESRARPLSAQVEAGNVYLVEADWNEPFLDELIVFPNGTHDDQADAASGAFNKLAMKRKVVMGIA